MMDHVDQARASIAGPDPDERYLNRPAIGFDRAHLREAVENRRVLVTGAAGSIGSFLTAFVRQLEPAALAVLDSHEASLFHLRNAIVAAERQLPPSEPTRFILADVRDRLKVTRVFDAFRPDVIFHLAAYKHVPLAEDNVDQVIGVNILGTLNVVEAARSHAVSVLVYPSTDKAVDPPSVYGASKRVVELFLLSLADQDEKPRPGIIRLVNVFGTQGSVVEVFTRQIQAGLPLSVTDPSMDRYWITMREANLLLVQAARLAGKPRIFMLEVGEPVRISDTARRVAELVGVASDRLTIHYTGPRPGERLHEKLRYSFEQIHRTDAPGLVAIDGTAKNYSFDEWCGILGDLRERLYDWGSEDLRARIFELSRLGREQGVQQP